MTLTLLRKTFEIEMNCVELTPLNRDSPPKAQPLNGLYLHFFLKSRHDAFAKNVFKSY